MDDMVQAVFVYGTLRRDLGYRSKFLPPTKEPLYATLGGVRMLHLGAFPGLVPDTDTISRVQGQFLDYSDLDPEHWDELMKGMDEYEGVPRFYNRKIEELSLLSGDKRFAWVYSLTDVDQFPEVPLVPRGDWKYQREERNGGV